MATINSMFELGSPVIHKITGVPTVNTDNWYIDSVSSSNTGLTVSKESDDEISITVPETYSGASSFVSLSSTVSSDITLTIKYRDNGVPGRTSDTTTCTFQWVGTYKQSGYNPICIANLGTKYFYLTIKGSDYSTTKLDCYITKQQAGSAVRTLSDVKSLSGTTHLTSSSGGSQYMYAIDPGYCRYIYSEEMETWGDSSSSKCIYIKVENNSDETNGSSVIKGDILSLVKEGSLHSGMFMGLFSGSYITKFEVDLPEPTCSDMYRNMFKDCTKLKSVSSFTKWPDTPTNTANSCCNSMFKGCTSLTSTPITKFGDRGDGSYSSMFEGCTSLNIDLSTLTFPSNTSYSEFYGTFKGCTKIHGVATLPATRLGGQCYEEMFMGCTSITECPVMSASGSLGQLCCYGMMSGTGITVIPTTLTFSPGTSYGSIGFNSLSNMFANCKSLTKIEGNMFYNRKELSSSCCYRMFYGCTSLTNALWPTSDNYYSGSLKEMFRGCTSLTSIPTAINDKYTWKGGVNCFNGMFSGCTSLTNVYRYILNYAGSYNNNSCAYMFSGCTSLVTSPCVQGAADSTGTDDTTFSYMFDGCSSLKYVSYESKKCKPNYTHWLRGVASGGTFSYCSDYNSWELSDVVADDSGIPADWTAVSYSNQIQV